MKIKKARLGGSEKADSQGLGENHFGAITKKQLRHSMRQGGCEG